MSPELISFVRAPCNVRMLFGVAFSWASGVNTIISSPTHKHTHPPWVLLQVI